MALQNVLCFHQQKSSPSARSREFTQDKYHSHPIGAKNEKQKRAGNLRSCSELVEELRLELASLTPTP